MTHLPGGRGVVAVLFLFSLLLLPSTGLAAKLQADLIDVKHGEARYLVSWEAGFWSSGTVFDSLNRANKKVVSKSQNFCTSQGYDRWRFASLGEIANDETLRAAWHIATGGTGKSHSTERVGNFISGVETHNRVRRVLILSKVEDARGPCKQAPAANANRSLVARGASTTDSPILGADELETADVDDSERVDLQSRQTAAEQGDPESQNKLGEMYQRGRGVSQDYRQAARWYRQAAEQGHGRAQFNLGRAYVEGLGVPGDHIQAYLWLNLASTSGDPRARGERDSLAEKMTPDQIAEAQRLAHEWWQTHEQ